MQSLIRRLLSNTAAHLLFVCVALALTIVLGVAWMPAFGLAVLTGCESTRSHQHLGSIVRPAAWNLRLVLTHAFLIYWIGAFALDGQHLLSLFLGLVLGWFALMTWPSRDEGSD